MSALTRHLELPSTELDLTTLDEWVSNFPEQEVRQALQEIAARERVLETQRRELEQWLTLFEQMAHPLPDVRHSAPPADQAVAGANGRGVSVKRQAILQLLGREPSKMFSARAIAANLADRGLMEANDKRAEKALSVMLAAMIDRGEIHRPMRAQYQFGPKRATKTEDPANTGVHTS